jgi:hypothetical protein
MDNKQKHQNWLKNKLFTEKKEKKYAFWHIGASCFETGMTRIPQIYPKVYSVSMIIVLKLPKN